MKKLNLIEMIFTMVLFTVSSTYAQDGTGSLWVTFEKATDLPVMQDGHLVSNNDQIQHLINQYNISSVQQALPASRKEELRKVYEVQCNCNGDAVREYT